VATAPRRRCPHAHTALSCGLWSRHGYGSSRSDRRPYCGPLAKPDFRFRRAAPGARARRLPPRLPPATAPVRLLGLQPVADVGRARKRAAAAPCACAVLEGNAIALLHLVLEHRAASECNPALRSEVEGRTVAAIAHKVEERIRIHSMRSNALSQSQCSLLDDVAQLRYGTEGHGLRSRRRSGFSCKLDSAHKRSP